LPIVSFEKQMASPNHYMNSKEETNHYESLKNTHINTVYDRPIVNQIEPENAYEYIRTKSNQNKK